MHLNKTSTRISETWTKIPYLSHQLLDSPYNYLKESKTLAELPQKCRYFLKFPAGKFWNLLKTERICSWKFEVLFKNVYFLVEAPKE